MIGSRVSLRGKKLVLHDADPREGASLPQRAQPHKHQDPAVIDRAPSERSEERFHQIQRSKGETPQRFTLFTTHRTHEGAREGQTT